MVAASGPSGILAGRPSSQQRQEATGSIIGSSNNNINNNNNNGNSKISKQQQQLDAQRHGSDLYVRPSWTDAAVALDQLEKGKAEGQRSAVWIRARLQEELSQLGCFLQRHPGKTLFVAVVALATFCVALKSVSVHSRAEQLWVQEGGRLERELRYATEILGEPATSTHQLVIQTPRDHDANILHANALKEHLAVLKIATQVNVRLGDTIWRLKDLCYAPAGPNFEIHYIDQIFDSMTPCAIITPLDCFWEGSQLLGPKDPVRIPGLENDAPVRWTNLNPMRMVERIKKLNFTFPYGTLEDFMKRAGITNGYQSKPCLDPQDPDCPVTAPNKNSPYPPDIGGELTGGCYGFAAKYMHWPEELLVGGAKRNKSGHLVSAAALQTVIQLMGERELFDYYSQNYKVHNVGWSTEKAGVVLDKWQRAFTKALKAAQNSSSGSSGEPARYDIYAFSTTAMNDVLGTYSRLDVLKVVVGCVLMVGYAGLALYRCKDLVRSQSGVAMAGVMLAVASLAAGLGFCTLLGIPFNAASTQIVPFLSLGLGVQDMFLLTHTYAELSSNEVPSNLQTGVVLKRTGLSILLTSLCNVAAFFAAAMIPIPAMRVFSLQAGILLLFNLAATLLVFPAMISLDLRRRRSGRSDIFCCCLPALAEPKRSSSSSTPRRVDEQQELTKKTKQQQQNDNWEAAESASLTGCSQDDCLSFSLTRLVSKYYAPFITSSATKTFGVLALIVILIGSVYEAMRIDDGLDLADLVPAHSDEHAFLAAQSRHFGFYNMFAVTGRDFDYPNHQRLLYDYHDAFVRVKNVVKNDNGGLPEFWLGLFRNWLINLQRAFDRDFNNNCISSEGWHPNATDEAVLAYKLLVQTGDVDNPVDKSLVSQVRLVNSDGIINPHAFYNYLSAWAANDALAYGASLANLRPEPMQWISTREFELKIPKSYPIEYAQMPFYLYKLSNTADITQLIGSVRAVCRKFEERGLPNFPSGIPFVFWEQYMDLRSCLGIALLAALGACVFVVGILLLNFWAAIFVGVALAGAVLQLVGIMGLSGIKLSAVTAVLLVLSIGIAVRFTVHVCLSFITSVGSRDRRVRLALEHMCAPLIHGAATTLLAAVMLGFSEFEFIVRHFVLVLVSLIGVSLVNGLFFFPILLSLIGPTAEVIPNEHPDRISTPTPPASPIPRRRSSSSKPPAPPKRLQHRVYESPVHSEPSSGGLTTIVEEPNSWCSQQESCIIVQPEVKVETSTCANQNCSGSDTSGSSRTSPVPPPSHITTKVTATVTAKIEVHTPLSRSNRSDKCRHSSSSSRGSRSSRCTTLVNTAESSGSSSEPDSDTSYNKKSSKR